MKRAGQGIINATVKRVAPQFFEQGHERVYVTSCCGRVLVTTEEATKCRTCDETPKGEWLTQEQVAALA